MHFLKFVHSIFQVCQALSSSSSSSSSTTISPSSSSHGGGEDRCCCLLLLVLLLFSRSFFIYYWIRSLLFLLLLLLRKKGRTSVDCVYDSFQRDADSKFRQPSVNSVRTYPQQNRIPSSRQSSDYQQAMNASPQKAAAATVVL